jgi:hypothetical protein
MSDLTVKWRKLLDVGTPVSDEENAAQVLEDVHNHFKDYPPYHEQHVNIILIPMIRRILSNVDHSLKFDPDFRVDKPYALSWVEELMEEMRSKFEVDALAEIVNVMTYEFAEQLKQGGNTFSIEFTAEEGELKNAIKFHVEEVQPNEE